MFDLSFLLDLITCEAGVCILSQNFIIAPKARQVRDENFYNCPQSAHCTQWNILKFPHFVPFLGSF